MSDNKGDNMLVRVERDGPVTTVIINRPQARNAVDRPTADALAAAFLEFENDNNARVAVLCGEGGTFCAGADLKAISRGENLYHPDHAEWGFAGYARHFIDKPTIAAVNGSALGGGTELVLASDLAVAEEGATFGLPEVKRGLLAAAGGVFRIVDQLPRKVALELIFCGEAISAARAAELGLLNQVVPNGDALSAALALAERIGGNAPLSVQASKRVALGAQGGVIPTEVPKWEQTTREYSVLKLSSDAKEGPLAFAEKRQPVWTAS